jgi:hypothetical protein
MGRRENWLLSAFAGERQTVAPERGTGISMEPATTCINGVGAALERQFEWQLERQSGIDSRMVTSWPTGSNPENRNIARATIFQDVVGGIDHIDEDIHAESMRMLDVQATRLLLIDDELWITTKPPVWRVDAVRYWGADEHTEVSLSLAHAYDGFDRKLTRRDFALDDFEAAKALFDRYSPKAKSSKYKRFTAIPRFEAADVSEMRCDADAAEMNRIGYAITTEFTRFEHLVERANWAMGNNQLDRVLGSSKEQRLLFERISYGDDAGAMLEEAKAATMSTNYILGRMGEISHLTTDLCDLWSRSGYHGSYVDVSPWPARFSRLVDERTRELAENAVIDIGFLPSATIGSQP